MEKVVVNSSGRWNVCMVILGDGRWGKGVVDKYVGIDYMMCVEVMFVFVGVVC